MLFYNNPEDVILEKKKNLVLRMLDPCRTDMVLDHNNFRAYTSKFLIKKSLTYVV